MACMQQAQVGCRTLQQHHCPNAEVLCSCGSGTDCTLHALAYQGHCYWP
jgi:hypothetical protein